MINKLLSYYKKQQFSPTFLSIFINPFFFIRRGLYKGISKNAGLLSGSLLDFGCGSKPYRNLFNVSSYIGVDIESKAHSHEKEPIDIYYNGKVLPFRNAQFDSVFSSEVLEHVFDLDEILCEINRVMKINGKGLFTVPFVWDEHEIPYDFGRYTQFGIKHVFNKAGFEIVSIEKTTHFTETLFQLWNLYLFYKFSTKNKYLNILLNIIFISPFTVIGIILSGILPKANTLYHDNVIVVKKIS